MHQLNLEYICYHSQSQLIRRNILHLQNNGYPSLPPNDESLMIHVLHNKLICATRQSFYIIGTPSQKFPDPIFHLTRFHGNLYKITFTPTNITCSCDNFYNPCKHILHLLLSLFWYQINHDCGTIFLIKVITLMH